MSEHEQTLEASVVSRYFESLEIQHGDEDPHEIDCHLGRYVAYDRAWSKLDEAARRFRKRPKPKKVEIGSGKIPFRYRLLFFKFPMTLLTDPDADTYSGLEYDMQALEEKIKGVSESDLGMFHFALNVRKADPASDSWPEMKACRFTYGRYISGFTTTDKESGASQTFEGLSPEARSQFRKNLKDINFTPTGIIPNGQVFEYGGKDGTYYDTAGWKFKRQLAETCTYDVKGEHFHKWRSGKKHSYIAANLTPDYLRKTIKEYTLQQGRTYLLQIYGNRTRLFLIRNSKRTDVNGVPYLKRDLIVPSLEPLPVGDEVGERPVFIFFGTADGYRRKSQSVKGAARLPDFSYYTVDRPAYLRMADPAAMVRRVIGKRDAKRLATRLKVKSQDDWFDEMVKAYFLAEFYAIDIERYWERGSSPNFDPAWSFLEQVRDKLHVSMEEQLAAVVAREPHRKPHVAAFRKLLADKNYLVVPQGLDVGEVKFIGTDEFYAYVRHMGNFVTMKMPLESFVLNLCNTHMFTKLYENSRGVIIFSKIVVWGSLAVIGLSFTVTGLSAAAIGNAVRRFGIKKARDITRDEIVRWAFKRVLPAVVAVVVEGLARLFDEPRWAAFAKGFFHGYVYQTMHKLLSNALDLKSISKRAFREYYWYQKAKRLYVVADRVADILDQVGSKIDKAAREQLAKNLVESADHLLKGVSLILASVYHSDHEEAHPLIELMGGGYADEAEWEEERKAQLITAVSEIGDGFLGQVEGALATTEDILSVIGDNKELLTVLTAVGMAALFKGSLKLKPQKKQGPEKKRGKAFPFVVIGLVVAGGAAAHYTTDGKSTEIGYEVLTKLLEELLDKLPGTDEAQAEVNGRLIGNLIGGVVLDRGLFGGKRADDLAKRNRKIKKLRKHLKHGMVMPILKVVLSRYIAFYRNLFVEQGEGKPATVESLLEDFAGLREENDPVLQRAKQFHSTDDGLALMDIVGGLLNADAFFDGELRQAWKSKYAGDVTRYKDDLAKFKRNADDLGLTALAQEYGPVLGIQFLLQMKLVCKELLSSLRLLFAQVGEELADGTRLSVMRLLELIGMDLNDARTVEQAFSAIADRKLEGFKVKP